MYIDNKSIGLNMVKSVVRHKKLLSNSVYRSNTIRNNEKNPHGQFL